MTAEQFNALWESIEANWPASTSKWKPHVYQQWARELGTRHVLDVALSLRECADADPDWPPSLPKIRQLVDLREARRAERLQELEDRRDRMVAARDRGEGWPFAWDAEPTDEQIEKLSDLIERWCEQWQIVRP